MFLVREHFPAKYQNVTEVEKDKAAYLLDALDCTINTSNNIICSVSTNLRPMDLMIAVQL